MSLPPVVSFSQSTIIPSPVTRPSLSSPRRSTAGATSLASSPMRISTSSANLDSSSSNVRSRTNSSLTSSTVSANTTSSTTSTSPMNSSSTNSTSPSSSSIDSTNNTTSSTKSSTKSSKTLEFSKKRAESDSAISPERSAPLSSYPGEIPAPNSTGPQTQTFVKEVKICESPSSFHRSAPAKPPRKPSLISFSHIINATAASSTTTTTTPTPTPTPTATILDLEFSSNQKSVVKVDESVIAATVGTSTTAFDYFKKEITTRKWILDVLSGHSKDMVTSEEEITTKLALLSDEKVELQSTLRDGILLCRLMSTVSLQSRSIPKIHEGNGLAAFKCKENVSFFLYALEEIGFNSNMKFEVDDLFDNHNMILVVDCLYALGHFQKTVEPPVCITEISLNENQIPQQRVAIVKLLLSQIKMKEEAKRRQATSTETNRMRSHTYAAIERSAVRPIGLAPSESQLQQQQKLREVEGRITRLQAIVRGRIARRKYRKLVRDLAYRENVAREILTTEEVYVKSLTLLKDVFLFPMNVMGFVTSAWLQGMLSNVQVIINYSQLLLSKLKPRVENWNSRQCLGDIFLQITNFLKVYTQYVKAYNQSLGELRKLKQEPKFLQFLKTASKYPGVDKMEINSFLIMPVQRIPRYEMLLKDLLKHTDPSHIDYKNLKDASGSVVEVASYVDEKKGEAENIYKVLELQDLFGSSFADLAKPHRRFVYECNVLILVKNKTEERKLVLFNDILVLSVREKKKKKERYKVEKQSPIFGVIFTALSEANGALRWGFDLTTANGSKLLRVYAKSADELKKWEKHFADLSSTFSMSISTLQRAGPGSSTTLMLSPRRRSVAEDTPPPSLISTSTSASTSTLQTINKTKAGSGRPERSTTTSSTSSTTSTSSSSSSTPDEMQTEKRRGSM